jgi:hypothetical protein
MGWMQLAMLAAGLAKTNKETQEAAKAGLRKSVAQQGEWILPTAGANEAVPVPNAWGNLMAGATSASQLGQQQKKSDQEDKYLDILGRRKSGSVVGDSGYNFDVPSANGFQMPAFGGY